MGKRKIDVTQVIKNSDGSDARSILRVLPEEVCETCNQQLVEDQPFTLRRALVRCLTVDPVDSRTGRPNPPDGATRYQYVRLAFRIEDNDVVGLSLEDITSIKKLAAVILTPVAMARVWDILDPPEEENHGSR